MSNQKLKAEQYQNLGGINSKLSPYLTGPMEFLDLCNLDFQKPGSLTLRWGSTQYIGQTFAGGVQSLYEYSQLSGASYIVVGQSGGIWIGSSTGLQNGMSMANMGTTQVAGYAIATMAYVNTVGPDDIETFYAGCYFDNNNKFPIYRNSYLSGAGGTITINPIIQSQNACDFVTFQDYLFAADGNTFWKTKGSTVYPVGVPIVGAVTMYITGTTAATDGKMVGLSTGQYVLFASYVNYRGVEGTPVPIAVVNSDLNGATWFSQAGTSYIKPNMDLTVPAAFYGISAVNFYAYKGTSFIDAADINRYDTTEYFKKNAFTLPKYFYQQVGISTNGVAHFSFGTTIGGISTADLSNDVFGELYSHQYNYGYGFTVFDSTPGSSLATTNLLYVGGAPRYLELYQNRLFMAGFSGAPSSLKFSEQGEPELTQDDWDFEVRTNDGDVVSCIKAYSTRLYVFKRNSFHILTGDSPQNFFLQEISDQYGCINNRCAVVYDDILIFLDRKGVIMWNGASLNVISSKVQPILDTMNYSTALNTACMVHDKIRNQVLISIPTGSSTVNDTTLVYDYVVGAWTVEKGFAPTVLAPIQGRNSTKNVFYGDSTGRVSWFGPSFLSDNGTGFTAYLKGRFFHDMGESTQKMFRRFFLNIDPPSATMSFAVNFYQDYGSSIVLGTTLTISQFQDRLDFGISGRSLSFEVANIQSSQVLRIHGFTLESRYLRRV